MQQPRVAALGAALLAVAPLLLSPAAPALPAAPLVPRLVGFEPGAPPPLEALEALGATVVRVDSRLDFAVVVVPDPAAFDALAPRLPGVAYVEPDFEVRAFGYDGEDAMQPEQWGLQAIRAPQAWDLLAGRAASSVIAVLDTGADWFHPDLAGAIWNGNGLHGDDLTGYFIAMTCASRALAIQDCFFLHQPPEEVTGPMDFHGHGSHVAGIAAATREGSGIAGVAPASVRVVKVLPTGNSVWSAIDIVASGIAIAAAEGSDVISLSLGCWCDSHTLARAVHYAWTEGSLIVAAAGNFDSSAPVYPGAYREVLSVAATNPQDGRWWVDAGIGSSYGPAVDIAAPGEAILSAQARWTANFGFYYVGLGYKRMSGTSMATPHVAGVAALVWQAAPQLTNAEVRDILLATARDIGAEGRDDFFGAGLVDAEAAVRAALGEPLHALRVHPAPPQNL